MIKEEMTMWAGQTDILPESLKPGRNAYLSRIQELETSGRKLDMAGDMRNPIQNPGMPEAVEPRTMEKETVCLDCCKEDRQMVVVPGRTGDLAAEIYYVTAYGEYCVKPHRRMTVFLESGQPLGEGREYYLPRGMRIYLENRDNSFGKAYYEGKFEDPLPCLLPLFDRITRIKAAQDKAPGICPGCGKPLKPGAAFCGQCGYKVK